MGVDSKGVEAQRGWAEGRETNIEAAIVSESFWERNLKPIFPVFVPFTKKIGTHATRLRSKNIFHDHAEVIRGLRIGETPKLLESTYAKLLTQEKRRRVKTG